MPIDPQCQILIDAANQAGGAPFEAADIMAIRDAYAKTTALYAHPTPDLKSVRDHKFDGPGSELRIRHYTAHSDLGAAVLFLHGGGWAAGDIDTHDHVCRYLCAKSGAAFFSLDYRLAPENQFPAALDDANAALSWLHAHADKLGFDVARLAIAGDSAGGNLAATVTLLNRDSGGPKIPFQLLIYPSLNFHADNASMRDNGEGYLLTRAAMERFIELYLSDPSLADDFRASPQRANHHEGLPAAFVMSAEFDPLRDEACAYAETLNAAGVSTEYKCYPGMIHGFLRMGAKVDLALTALDDAAHRLSEALHA
ncbi:MAG: alpha/beta hydrolase [Pseudomonadota bacterium]